MLKVFFNGLHHISSVLFATILFGKRRMVSRVLVLIVQIVHLLRTQVDCLRSNIIIKLLLIHASRICFLVVFRPCFVYNLLVVVYALQGYIFPSSSHLFLVALSKKLSKLSLHYSFVLKLIAFELTARCIHRICDSRLQLTANYVSGHSYNPVHQTIQGLVSDCEIVYAPHCTPEETLYYSPRLVFEVPCPLRACGLYACLLLSILSDIRVNTI